jgi:hypothetical protein
LDLFLAFVGSRKRGPRGAPIARLELAIELRCRIHHDLVKQRLNGLRVFFGGAFENSWNDNTDIRRRPKYSLDPRRWLSFPVRPDDQVRSRLASIHLSQLSKLVGALIDDLVHPEAVAKIRHLEYDRFAVQ